MGDPAKIGLVSSLARPGGNVTGLSAQGYDTPPKHLELAKELVPGLRRLYVLFEDDAEPGLTAYTDREFRALAGSAGVTLRILPTRTPSDIQAALKTILADRPQAVLLWATPLTIQYRDMILTTIARQVPVISETRQFARAGAVLTYSVDFTDMFRRSAAYVDKILKGAKPGDLPIEQPTKFDLVVNIRIANALGVKVPDTVLVRAQEIIQ
jgi:putative tryptophan/tyrosine transport system substrate-binding protein